jgi:hypothetical protein
LRKKVIFLYFFLDFFLVQLTFFVILPNIWNVFFLNG